MSLVELMRQDWDERARRNAFHYIASWQEEWDLDAFLASGEYDYDTLVAPVLDRCGIPKSGECMLELGCGAGRMTRNFASRYRRVLAVDLSAEMLSRARKIHSSLENISWLRVGGADLACLASGSVDFVFSYLVLQHLPTRALAEQYIQEMLRVLRSGGGFMFQFNGSTAPTMNLRGRIAWRLVDALWSARLRSASRVVAAMLGLDPAAAGKSWRGAAIESSLVLHVVHDASGIVLETSGQGTPMTWCCGVKSGTRTCSGF